jgi:hypothetical protein
MSIKRYFISLSTESPRMRRTKSTILDYGIDPRVASRVGRFLALLLRESVGREGLPLGDGRSEKYSGPDSHYVFDWTAG